MLMEINRMQLDLLRELRRDVPPIAAPGEGAGDDARNASG